MKKLLAILLALVLTFSVVGTCMAEENAVVDAVVSAEEEVKTVEMEKYDISTLFKEKDSWKTSKSSGGGLHDVTISDTGIVAKDKDMAVTGIKYAELDNKLIQFDFTPSYKSAAGESAWSAITIKSTVEDNVIWQAGSGYLFVINENRIELQRWLGGQTFLDIIPNTYAKHGEKMSVSIGTLDVEDGTNIFLFINGECAINVFDPVATASKSKDGGINFYLPTGAEVSKYTGGEIAPVPFGIQVEGTPKAGEKLNASYQVATFGEEKALDVNLNWYFSETHSGTIDEFEEINLKDFPSYKPVGEYKDLAISGNECEITEEYQKGFYLVKAEDKEAGVSAFSAPYEVDYDKYFAEYLATYLEKETIFLKLDCQYSYVKGEKFEIDPDDFHVVPTLVNDRTLVPVRFIAERYGAEVGWEDATKTVTIKLDGKTIKMVIDEAKYTVDDKEFTLDVPATTIYDRTMVPVRVISEAFEKAVYWDGDNELICIYGNDVKDLINFADYTDFLKSMATDIEKPAA